MDSFHCWCAWIGASFYFNWLENHLNRKAPQDEGIAGNLWAVHGGGFYHLKKFTNGPKKLPETLHWFKWEAYMTWLSGTTLLIIFYYFNAQAMMIDPSIHDIKPLSAVILGFASLIISWIVYDQLCKSSLKEKPLILGVILFVYLTGLAYFLSQILSARAAYIHVGAAIGTIMVANVFFVIIPAQKELVNALVAGSTPDPKFGASGLLRSRHNNYLTLPVLFIMISNHFPSTYGNQYSWLVLIAVSVVGVLARHYFNIRHLTADTLIGVSGGPSGALEPVLLRTRAPNRDVFAWKRGETTASPEEIMSFNGITADAITDCVKSKA